MAQTVLTLRLERRLTQTVKDVSLLLECGVRGGKKKSQNNSELSRWLKLIQPLVLMFSPVVADLAVTVQRRSHARLQVIQSH